MNRRRLEKIILSLLFLFGIISLLRFNLLGTYNENQFTSLAHSFLKGHVFLGVNNGSWLDASYYKGYAYWPQGFFPAVVLLPFAVLSNSWFAQPFMQLLLNLINIFLLYKISFKITDNKITSLWLSFGYIFSTAYIAIGFVPWSWWFAQVTATCLLLLCLYEYFYRRRWILIGVYIACAFATRIDLFISILFFIGVITLSRQPTSIKIKNTIRLFIPVSIGLLIVVLYNYLRFGSPVEFGYAYHIPELATTRSLLKIYGAWNLFYYPTNLYYLFVKGFDQYVLTGTGYLVYPYLVPNIWGMSILITSPILIWCFSRIKLIASNKDVMFSFLVSFVILLFLLGYFGIGTRQFGYRYALDFSPFLYIILCYTFATGMGRLPKAVIALSFLLDFYFFQKIFPLVLK